MSLNKLEKILAASTIIGEVVISVGLAISNKYTGIDGSESLVELGRYLTSSGATLFSISVAALIMPFIVTGEAPKSRKAIRINYNQQNKYHLN